MGPIQFNNILGRLVIRYLTDGADCCHNPYFIPWFALDRECAAWQLETVCMSKLVVPVA